MGVVEEIEEVEEVLKPYKAARHRGCLESSDSLWIGSGVRFPVINWKSSQYVEAGKASFDDDGLRRKWWGYR